MTTEHTAAAAIHQDAQVSTTMRAVCQEQYGSADTLSVRTIERPSITASQVLIEVQAAGIDRGVWHLMTGTPLLTRVAFGLRAPKQPVPGLDVAGRVVAVGADVTRLKPGDEVFGVAIGSFAEYAAAEEHKLSIKPASVTWEQAGVTAISGLTALQSLTEVAHVQPGQHVLVLGASGGVGTYAVQVAKALGAEVTGVASAAKADLVRSLGADHVLDYRTDDFADGSAAYDVIVDTGGMNSLKRLRRALTPRGTLVIVGGESDARVTGGVGRQGRALLLSPFVSQRLTALISKEDHATIDKLAEMLDSGALVPSIDRVVTLDEVAPAIHALEAGEVRGKVAVRVRT
jgi:NADPH:quinone reductase-like Zn-dependent oxidoreductase